MSIREIKVMKELVGVEYTMQLEACYEYEEVFVLVMKKARCDLFDYIAEISKEDFYYEEMNKLYQQIIKGLKNLHERDIYHSDIKPENIFITDDNNVLIGDFGFSDIYEASSSYHLQHGGTLLYCSMELLIPDKYCPFASDIYTMGMLYFFMLSKGRVPFSISLFESCEDLYIFKQNIKIDLDDFSDSVTAKQVLLIEFMIANIPQNRPSIYHLEMFFNNENKEKILSSKYSYFSDFNALPNKIPFSNAKTSFDTIPIIPSLNNNKSSYRRKRSSSEPLFF
eukprot:TRINITY_DN2234_c0_g1_i2.p1 TRINITY_DN2234_c0_g1~~TRINITY_DN2234_c0_g1_i2.p1  ORF type:complete len:281 (-),score=65.20 TRINITY_DN2234_c0_g1_i2:119-961(-)